MNFNTVKWQDDIVNNLKNSIKESSLNHAILFTGDTANGVLLANAAADAVLCDINTGNACGKCSSCIKTSAGSHPDKIIVSASKATIGINEIRQVINLMYIRPYIADKKIFIFTDAWKMTESAQNALLKVLEAPPDYGMFFLVAEKEEQLLETVLSRLTKFKLSIPDREQVYKYLLLKYPEKKDAAMFAARFCDGNPALAEKVLLDDFHGDKRKRLLIFITKVINSGKSCVFDFAAYLTDFKDEFESNTEYIHVLLRDLIFIKTGVSQNRIVNTDLYDSLYDASKNISTNSILSFADKFSYCLGARKKNAAFQLTVLNALLRIWEEIHGRNNCS